MFLAAADRKDPAHSACRDLIEGHPGPLVTTALAIAEVGWLIDRQLGPTTEAAFYRGVATGGITVEALTPDDWARVAELVDRYADPLGGTDASLVTLAERLGATQIATLDHRHSKSSGPLT